jgi:hypothetical protein
MRELFLAAVLAVNLVITLVLLLRINRLESLFHGLVDGWKRRRGG